MLTHPLKFFVLQNLFKNVFADWKQISDASAKSIKIKALQCYLKPLETNIDLDRYTSCSRLCGAPHYWAWGPGTYRTSNLGS